MIKEKLLDKWLQEIREEMEELDELEDFLVFERHKGECLKITIPADISENKLTENMKSGEILAYKRAQKHMTQNELATAVGVGRSMIAQIERGTKSVTLQLGAEIARVLGCDVNDFIR